MAPSCLQLTSLLLLFTSGTLTLDCDHIIKYQKGEIGNISRLLEAMGTQQVSWECFHKMPDFAFPMGKVLGFNKEDGRAAVGLMLEQIQRIFWHNFTQAEWNTTVTELFQTNLNQKVEEWNRCSVTKTGEEATFKDFRINLTLKKYFIKLHKFLEGEEYSHCAWNVVRQEILGINLVVLDQLLTSLQN